MILGYMLGTAAESPGSNAAGQELRTLLKTINVVMRPFVTMRLDGPSDSRPPGIA
jgi:hypothetical protein